MSHINRQVIAIQGKGAHTHDMQLNEIVYIILLPDELLFIVSVWLTINFKKKSQRKYFIH